MDADDLELLERGLRNATALHSGVELDDALSELGFLDALADDPRAAISTLFFLQGGATATSSAIENVIVDALGMTGDAQAVLLPSLGGADPPGNRRGDTVAVNGVTAQQWGEQDLALVVLRDGADHGAALVAVSDLERTPIAGIDPAAGLATVHAEIAPGAITPLSATDWSACVARARLAVGHELAGLSRTMLAMAREHAIEREQFGQPIGKFQAIRHRLAETLVAIEAADALLGAAWDDGSPTTAAMAKAVAGRSARTTARHAQQILAGIGFTTEHDFHLSFRRVMILDAMFGSSRTLTTELGTELVSTRVLPAGQPL